MKNLLKALFGKNEIIKTKTRLELFFEELNRAYRAGEERLEYFISDWPCGDDENEDFKRLYRCLIHYYDLNIDIKTKGVGPYNEQDEYLIVNLKNVYIAKSQGFSFVEVDPNAKRVSKRKNTLPNWDETTSLDYILKENGIDFSMQNKNYYSSSLPKMKPTSNVIPFPKKKRKPEAQKVEDNVIYVDFKKGK